MKRFAKHIAAALLAFTMLMVGSGVNYIRYCCNECRAEGIGTMFHTRHIADATPTTEQNDCCAAKQQPVNSMACDHQSHTEKKDCCTVTRLQIDLNDQIAKITVNTDFTWHIDLPNNHLLCASIAQPAVSNERFYPPPLHTSRHLLSLKSVLLI